MKSNHTKPSAPPADAVYSQEGQKHGGRIAFCVAKVSPAGAVALTYLWADDHPGAAAPHTGNLIQLVDGLDEGQIRFAVAVHLGIRREHENKIQVVRDHAPPELDAALSEALAEVVEEFEMWALNHLPGVSLEPIRAGGNRCYVSPMVQVAFVAFGGGYAAALVATGTVKP